MSCIATGRRPAHSKITRGNTHCRTQVCCHVPAGRAEHSAGHGGVKTRYKQEAHKTDCSSAQQKSKLAQVDRPINLPFDCQSEQSPRFWAVKPGRQRDRRGGAKESPVGLSSTSPPLDKHSFEASTQRSPPPYLTRRHRPQPSLYTTYTPYNRPLLCK
jgi:hypothetical protein